MSILSVEQVGGTLGINVLDGWPSLTVTTIEEFADGGTYTPLSMDKRLRVVHTPRP